MERKIGEIFTCGDKTYQVVKGITCRGCIFMKDGNCYTVRESLGPCDYTNRTDKIGIIFKEVNNMEISSWLPSFRHHQFNYIVPVSL